MLLFTALAVLLDFLLQVTAFVALIALDSLRAEDKRVDCFPCIKLHSLHAESDKGTITNFPRSSLKSISLEDQNGHLLLKNI